MRHAPRGWDAGGGDSPTSRDKAGSEKQAWGAMRLREGGTEERLALVKWGWNSITERQKSMALYQPQAAGGAHHRLSESGGVRNLSTTFFPPVLQRSRSKSWSGGPLSPSGGCRTGIAPRPPSSSSWLFPAPSLPRRTLPLDPHREGGLRRQI